MPFCDLRYGNCPDNGECFPIDIDNPAYKNIGICIYGNCQTDASCSEENKVCKWLAPSVQLCDEAGTMSVGKACNKNYKCDKNSLCIQGECIRFCDFIGKKPCENGYSCLSWSYIAFGRTPSDFGICLPSCNPGVCGNEATYNEYCECDEEVSSFCNVSKVDNCEGICALIGEDKGLCITDTCNPQNNNCPIGTKCLITAGSGFYSCLPEKNGKPMGESCINHDECETGSYCFQALDTTKTCNRFCKENADCLGSLSSSFFDCIKEKDSWLMGACVKSECDPQSAVNQCEEGHHCALSPYGNHVCQPSGNIDIDSRCSLLTGNLISCKSELYCYKNDEDTSPKCQKFCHNNNECPSGAECYKEGSDDFIGFCKFPQ